MTAVNQKMSNGQLTQFFNQSAQTAPDILSNQSCDLTHSVV